MNNQHEITRILCSKLDKRKARLHTIGGENNFTDGICNMLRDAIKDPNHGYRNEVLRDISAPKKPKKKKNRKKKGKSRERKAVKRTTPRTKAWVSREDWLKETDKFYASRAWKEVRYFVLRRDGATCACCGARASDGVCMWVDHIKPRSVYPELQLDPENMQVLCDDCNQGKSNYYSDDWRVKMA